MAELDAPEMAEIPAGVFTLGDAWGDGDPDERPARAHRVEAFRLGKYAVTNRQYLCFLNERKDSGGAGGKNGTACEEGVASRRRTGFGNHPATYVSWLSAAAYCEWLTRVTGRRCYLPTEAQWQYASMGGREFKWALGSEFDSRQYVCAADGAAPVDYGEASIWGLYNMTGNVFEWCQDEYAFSHDVSAPNNTLRNNRVIKGGAFILSEPMNLRNAKRFSAHQSSSLCSIGFRVAQDR